MGGSLFPGANAPVAPPSSGDLIRRARRGERTAIDALFARHLPSLHRWARGRIPRWARELGDTADVVQDSILAVFGRLETFEPRREGAFRAYLRQAVMNRIRDQYRRTAVRPLRVDLDPAQPSGGQSPLDAAIDGEASARYARALATLPPDDREAIVARVELGYSYEQIAALLRKRSPDAARMAVSRAIAKLARAMADDT